MPITLNEKVFGLVNGLGVYDNPADYYEAFKSQEGVRMATFKELKDKYKETNDYEEFVKFYTGQTEQYWQRRSDFNVENYDAFDSEMNTNEDFRRMVFEDWSKSKNKSDEDYPEFLMRYVDRGEETAWNAFYKGLIGERAVGMTALADPEEGRLDMLDLMYLKPHDEDKKWQELMHIAGNVAPMAVAATLTATGAGAPLATALFYVQTGLGALQSAGNQRIRVLEQNLVRAGQGLEPISKEAETFTALMSGIFTFATEYVGGKLTLGMAKGLTESLLSTSGKTIAKQLANKEYKLASKAIAGLLYNVGIHITGQATEEGLEEVVEGFLNNVNTKLLVDERQRIGEGLGKGFVQGFVGGIMIGLPSGITGTVSSMNDPHIQLASHLMYEKQLTQADALGATQFIYDTIQDQETIDILKVNDKDLDTMLKWYEANKDLVKRRAWQEFLNSKIFNSILNKEELDYLKVKFRPKDADNDIINTLLLHSTTKTNREYYRGRLKLASMLSSSLGISLNEFLGISEETNLDKSPESATEAVKKVQTLDGIIDLYMSRADTKRDNLIQLVRDNTKIDIDGRLSDTEVYKRLLVTFLASPSFGARNKAIQNSIKDELTEGKITIPDTTIGTAEQRTARAVSVIKASGKPTKNADTINLNGIDMKLDTSKPNQLVVTEVSINNRNKQQILLNLAYMKNIADNLGVQFTISGINSTKAAENSINSFFKSQSFKAYKNGSYVFRPGKRPKMSEALETKIARIQKEYGKVTKEFSPVDAKGNILVQEKEETTSPKKPNVPVKPKKAGTKAKVKSEVKQNETAEAIVTEETSAQAIPIEETKAPTNEKGEKEKLAEQEKRVLGKLEERKLEVQHIPRETIEDEMLGFLEKRSKLKDKIASLEAKMKDEINAINRASSYTNIEKGVKIDLIKQKYKPQIDTMQDKVNMLEFRVKKLNKDLENGVYSLRVRKVSERANVNETQGALLEKLRDLSIDYAALDETTPEIRRELLADKIKVLKYLIHSIENEGEFAVSDQVLTDDTILNNSIEGLTPDDIYFALKGIYYNAEDGTAHVPTYVFLRAMLSPNAQTVYTDLLIYASSVTDYFDLSDDRVALLKDEVKALSSVKGMEQEEVAQTTMLRYVDSVSIILKKPSLRPGNKYLFDIVHELVHSTLVTTNKEAREYLEINLKKLTDLAVDVYETNKNNLGFRMLMARNGIHLEKVLTSLSATIDAYNKGEGFEEFAAWALSDPDFARFLATIPYEGDIEKSGYTSLYNFVAQTITEAGNIEGASKINVGNTLVQVLNNFQELAMNKDLVMTNENIVYAKKGQKVEDTSLEDPSMKKFLSLTSDGALGVRATISELVKKYGEENIPVIEFVEGITSDKTKAIYNSFYNLIRNTKIKLDVSKKAVARLRRVKDAEGMYNPDTDAITVYPVFEYDSEAEYLRAIHHEVIHGIIEIADLDGRERTKLNVELKKIFNHIMKQTEKGVPEEVAEILKAIDGATNAKLVMDPDTGDYVPFYEELITYAFTNVAFADYLLKTPYQGKGKTKSVFTRLKEILKHIININPNYYTALDQINKAVDHYFAETLGSTFIKENLKKAKPVDANVFKGEIDGVEYTIAENAKGKYWYDKDTDVILGKSKEEAIKKLRELSISNSIEATQVSDLEVTGPTYDYAVSVLQKTYNLTEDQAHTLASVTRALGMDTGDIKYASKGTTQGTAVFQLSNGVTISAVELLGDGTTILRGFKDANFSSGLFTHAIVARRRLLNKKVKPENRAGITNTDIDIAENWCGVKKGVWTPEADKKFANGFIQYVMTEKEPAHGLRGLFNKIRGWLGSIFQSIASNTDMEISESMRTVYAKMLSRGNPKTGKILAKVNENESKHIKVEGNKVLKSDDAKKQQQALKEIYELFRDSIEPKAFSEVDAEKLIFEGDPTDPKLDKIGAEFFLRVLTMNNILLKHESGFHVSAEVRHDIDAYYRDLNNRLGSVLALQGEHPQQSYDNIMYMYAQINKQLSSIAKFMTERFKEATSLDFRLRNIASRSIVALKSLPSHQNALIEKFMVDLLFLDKVNKQIYKSLSKQDKIKFDMVAPLLFERKDMLKTKLFKELPTSLQEYIKTNYSKYVEAVDNIATMMEEVGGLPNGRFAEAFKARNKESIERLNERLKAGQLTKDQAAKVKKKITNLEKLNSYIDNFNYMNMTMVKLYVKRYDALVESAIEKHNSGKKLTDEEIYALQMALNAPYDKLPFIKYQRETIKSIISKERSKSNIQLPKKESAGMAISRRIPTLDYAVTHGLVNAENLSYAVIMASMAFNAAETIAYGTAVQQFVKDGLIIDLKTKDSKKPENFSRIRRRDFITNWGIAPVGTTSEFLAIHNDIKQYLLEVKEASETSRGLYQRLLRSSKNKVFINPLRLPLNDTVQAYMLGTLTLPGFVKAWKDVEYRADVYYDMVLNSGVSAPSIVPKQVWAQNFIKAHKNILGKIVYSVAYSLNKANLTKVGEGKFLNYLKTPMALINEIYNASQETAWHLDQVLRMMSFNALLELGYTTQQAGQYTALYHGDYANVPPKVRRALNRIFFTPSFRISMIKLYSDMARSIGKAIKNPNQVGYHDVINSRAVLNILVLNSAFDMLMLGLGYKRDEWGRRYRRMIETPTGYKDMVITFTHPANLVQNYIGKFSKMFDPTYTDKFKTFLTAFQFDFHPLWRVLFEAYNNYDNTVSDPLAPPHVQFMQVTKYMTLRLIPLLAYVEGAPGDIDKQRSLDILSRETNNYVGVILSLLFSAYETMPEEIRASHKIQEIVKIASEVEIGPNGEPKAYNPKRIKRMLKLINDIRWQMDNKDKEGYDEYKEALKYLRSQH